MYPCFQNFWDDSDGVASAWYTVAFFYLNRCDFVFMNVVLEIRLVADIGPSLKTVLDVSLPIRTIRLQNWFTLSVQSLVALLFVCNGCNFASQNVGNKSLQTELGLHRF